MVDVAPYQGNYVGTIVRDNAIDAQEARIHVGVGMGSNIWQCPWPDEAPRPPLYGGVVVNNTLVGNNMGYGFAINGVKDWTVLENKDLSAHVGEPSVGCNGRMPSAPGGFQVDLTTSQGTFQSDFESASLGSLVETFPIQELTEGQPSLQSSLGFLGGADTLLAASPSLRVEDQLDLVYVH